MNLFPSASSMKNVVRQRGINFSEFTSSRIPLSISRSSSPFLLLPHRFATDTLGHISRPTRRRRKYFTRTKVNTKEQRGGGIGVLPRGNEKWPTCQCALSHRDKSHAGSETLRLLTRKIPGGKSRECGNVRAPNPSPSSSLTVDDGKLEKYQIEFGSWRTVIKSFEFLLPLPPHLSLFSHRQIDPLFPLPVYSYNTPRRLSRLKFCIQSDRFVRIVVSRDKRFI